MGEKESGGTLSGEDIVISGISGSFPLAENTQELIHNLRNKVDMITKFDHGIKHPELPQYSGKIANTTCFDSHFFRFTHMQAVSFDPIGRRNMEQAFCAIFDAGINPETLKGTKIGVFIGTSQSDAASLSLFNPKKVNSFSISGTSKAMLANRISYWMDGKGPSVSLDQGWASSMVCLELAVERIKSGECDSALVGGCNRALHPFVFMNMRKAGLLCLDGKTKCFDKNGDGYVRSDAINMIFIQKAKDAKRVYTQIYDIKGKYFSTPDSTFLPTRNSEDITKFLQEFYTTIDVSPDEVEYVEASATGIAEADKTELEAIGNVFGQTKPIKVGSIKANIGHTEPVSGLCSLTKLCLSYQNGEIPPNIHYSEPHDIDAIRDGKATVVTENTEFNRCFTAINNFSYSGANYHVLLKGHYIPKDLNKYNSEIPRLVLVSGRLDESVTKILSILEENPIDPEQIALLNNIFKYNIPGHTGRGYTVIETNDMNQTACLARGFEIYDGNTRPIWFLYSGMGSQWQTMGVQLMRLPIFAAAIERCDKVLQPKGLDIVQIISNDDPEIFNNILNSFVGITAIQIALTDVIKSIGITPERIIGHSVGEIACAYADGSLTLEEAILCAYLRGKVSLETKMIIGKMAAVGLGHHDVRKICPPEIDIACENSDESTTISGPAEDVEKFVAHLTEQSIFARTVASSDIAFHSRYIADAGPSLFSKLKDIVKTPKLRTKKWLSTSYTPDKWSEDGSLYASAEYFTHNLLSTVHFAETAKMIPNDAVVIEIAPHGLLQAIMKRSHKSCKNISLTRRGEKDGIKLFLQTIGTLYQVGLNPDIDALYPKVEFPVSTNTPMLSHFVKWNHSTKWFEDVYTTDEKIKTVSYEFTMSVLDDEYGYFKGCVKNGHTIFPEAATLVIVWKTVAMYNGTNYTETSIEFSNVTFFDQIIIDDENILKLLVEIQKGTNYFEVTHNNKIIATGFIKAEVSVGETFENESFNESDYQLNENDIYKILSTRGYDYEGQFKAIKNTNIERTKGLVKWNDNWITFLDSVLQLNILSRNHNGLSDLKVITKLAIDIEAHKILKKTNYFNDLDRDTCYGAQVLYNNAVTKCGGVLLTSVNFKDIPEQSHITKHIQMKDLPHIPIQDKQINVKLINEIVDGSDDYTWVEVPLKSYNEETIKVFYSGINLNDTKKYAQISKKFNKYGIGFSGVNARGEKLMGIVPDGSVSSVVVPDCNLIWPVPKHWCLDEAATVPLPYVQAFYCLRIREDLRRKSNIYITNGDSAFGQALISVCLSFDCAVFTTVNNDENKKLLMKTFPKLRDNHVACGNDVSFRHIVSNATNNELCDFVISSETGQWRQEAMGLVGSYGIFLDLSDHDMEENQNYGMAFNRQAKTYKSVRLSNVFLTEYSSDRKKLSKMLIDGIKDGSVKPLARVIYSPNEISRAFKLLTVNSICSVLINMKDTIIFKEDNKIMPRLELSPTKSYIVVCDGTVYGIELIEHLVQRGAKQIVIHIKPKLMNGYFHVKYAQWKNKDVVINLNCEDLHTKSTCESLIGEKFKDIDGIFVTYTELTDKPDKINQYGTNISLAIANLDMASRNCNLSYFAVVYTTQNEGDRYVFTEIEKICTKRHGIGLPSVVLHYKATGEKNLSQVLSKLYNVLETSLKKKQTCVFISDSNENSDVNDKKIQIKDGLKAFLNKITDDECTAAEPIINMKTQLNYEMESELNCDPDDCYLMMIPGLDGIYEGMRSISERLKIPTVTLQLGPDLVTSIPDIAKSIFNSIKKRINYNSRFFILGYSFGVNVALELAVLLEKEGRTGVVFCLDSSPDVFNHQLTAYTGNLTDQQLQNSIIEHFYNILTEETSDKLKEDLANTSEWSEKVNIVVNKVKTSVSYTHEFLKTFINAAYSRIVMAKEYKPDFKLNSDIVLIKGTPHPRSEKLSDDYDLSKYSKQPVKVYNIEADHATAPEDVRISNIVNKMLDPELIKDFEKKNLCQYYFY